MSKVNNSIHENIKVFDPKKYRKKTNTNYKKKVLFDKYIYFLPFVLDC